MYYYMLEGNSVRIINRISSDFPSVFVDENRVIQIVFNLLHNAVKYTPNGEIKIQASVRNNIAYISIEDTGIGMDKETIKTIFSPYTQGASGEAMKIGRASCRERV